MNSSLIRVALAMALVGQAFGLDLQILAGSGTRHVAGGKSSLGILVRVTDDLGRPVPGSQVVFQLPETGPTGKFLGGKRDETVVSDPDGIAEAGVVAWSHSAGPVTSAISAVSGESRAATLVPQELRVSGKATSSATTFIRVAISTGAAVALAVLLKSHNSQAPTQVGSPTVSIKP